jgi:hypothetical protein
LQGGAAGNPVSERCGFLRAGLLKLPPYEGTWIFLATGQNRTVINSIRAYLA